MPHGSLLYVEVVQLFLLFKIIVDAYGHDIGKA